MSRQIAGLLPLLLLILAVISLPSCSRFDGLIPREAGDNRPQLEAVLEHYSQPSAPAQQYEAAEFLVKHMGWHISAENDSVYPDAAILSASFLKEHIDHAFKQWRTSPYAKDLTFEEFCEYLLPYRASHGFGQHVTAQERYNWVLEYIDIPDTITDVKELIRHYNKGVHELRLRGGKRGATYREGLKDLFYEDFTDCADKAVQTCLNLRAMGVPCVVEHNLGYRTFKAHHYHCAVWDTQNKEWIKFDAEGIRDYPGEGDWTSAELLNVYRETYAPVASAPGIEEGLMPYGFESPCQVDVTHHTVCIELPLTSELEECVPFLATFHRSATGLQPFTSGYQEGNNIVFDRVVPTLWYVVTIYPSGQERIVSRPFRVDEDSSGKVEITYVDFGDRNNDLEDIVLYRKYPIKERLVKRVQTLIGTTIVGANKPDFSDAATLWSLNSMPQPKRINYPFNASGMYCYYQLRTPEACEVSVLEWLTDDGPISTSPTANKAYDGNMTTAPTDSTQITLLLPDKQRITSVNFAPINADNAVRPGQIYQLYTWQDYNGWRLHSSQRASADSIVFKRVPRGTLLWLKNISSGQEEMPFFHKSNGQQQFIYH